jgi:hypothetical protein
MRSMMDWEPDRRWGRGSEEAQGVRPERGASVGEAARGLPDHAGAGMRERVP